MKKSTKIFGLIFIFLIFFSVVFSLSDIPLGLFNYVDIHSYHSVMGSSTVINDIWISPIISGSYYSFCIFPILGYQHKGPPYRAGIAVVDYNNKNKCQKIELLELVLVKNSQKLRLVDINSEPVSSEFSTYIDRVDHMKAECFVDVGNWIEPDNEVPITIRTRFRIYKKDGMLEDEANV